MKKIISLFIVLSVLVSALLMMSVSTSADPAPAVWDGSTAAAFAGCDGTEANPYQISNGAELALLQAKIADGEQAANYYDKYYILTADIVLNEGDATTWGTTAPANSFTPIGVWNNATSSFGGHFDGQGHTISGLYITNTYVEGVSGIDGGIGLFGCIQGGAEIKNLILVNSYIESTNTGGVGAIVGQTDRQNEGNITISNIYTDAILVGNGTEVGGIIGNLSNSTVNSTGDITFTAGKVTVDRATFVGSVSATGYVAGIIGNVRNVAVDIKNCLVDAEIRNTNSSGTQYAAGFITKSNVQIKVNGTNTKFNDPSHFKAETQQEITNCILAGGSVTCATSGTKYNMAYASVNSSSYKPAVSNCYDAIGITDVRNADTTDCEDIIEAKLYGAYTGEGVIDWATWSNGNWVSKTDDIARPKGVAENFVIHQQVLQTTFTVTWMNGEEVLAVENYAVGDMPSYKGEAPTKAEDEHYTYSFNRWTPELEVVTEDATYTAEFYRTRKSSGTTAATEDDTTTAPTTDAPTTTKAPESKPAKKGCKSVIGGGVLVLVAVMGIGAVSLGKKED